MKSMRWPLATTLAALSAHALLAQTAAGDPYAGLKTYDFANRAPVAAVKQMIRENLSAPGKLAEIETGLIGVLQDPTSTFGGRQEACRMLYMIGTARSVPALAALLNDEKLGDDARYALERDNDPTAGEALRAALSSAQGKPLIGVIDSVGDRRDPEAVKNLKPLASNPDPALSAAAITALGKIATGDAIDVLKSLPANDPRAARALAHAGDRLAAEGKKRDAERVYLDLVASGFDAVQADALHGLLLIGSRKTPYAALRDLQSADSELQVIAAGVVTAVGSTSVLEQVASAYPTLPVTAQIAVIAGFGSRHYSPAAPLVEQAMSASDPALRMAGIRAAGAIEGPAAVPTLSKLAAAGQDSERQRARNALIELPGSDADNAILALERSAPDDQRGVLLGVLADRQSPAYRASLLDAARGSDDKIAATAVQTLGKAGSADDIPALAGVLKSTRNDAVRDNCGEAIVSLAEHAPDRDRALEPLIDSLPGASVAARITIVGALAEVGGAKAIDAVAQATQSPDADVKSAAVTGLAENTTDVAALPVLWNLAKSDSNRAVRVQALRGYLRLIASADRMPVGEKVDHLKAALQLAERPEEKKQALSDLRECRTEAAVDVAAASLGDPAVFDEAADTVLYLAAPQKRGNNNEPAVKGPGTMAALEKVIQMAKDNNVRAKAQSLRG